MACRFCRDSAVDAFRHFAQRNFPQYREFFRLKKVFQRPANLIRRIDFPGLQPINEVFDGEIDVDDLVVAKAWTGKDMVLKRFHARGRGKGARILKPFSELTIVVREEKQEEKKKKSKGKPGAKKPAAAKKEAA